MSNQNVAIHSAIRVFSLVIKTLNYYIMCALT